MSDEIMSNIPEDENEDRIVEFIDENGESTLFEHLATLEYNGESYLAVCDPESKDEELEVFILKIDTDENGQDVYTVPDDEVSDAVFQQLLEMSEDLGGLFFHSFRSLFFFFLTAYISLSARVIK